MKPELRWALLFLVSIFTAGCDGDPAQGPRAPYANCHLEPLPLSAGADAPVLTVAILECQTPYLNLLVTAEDPQGDADLLGVQQHIGVFPDPDCNSSPKVVMDNLAGSGIEESFGIVFEESADPGVFAAICAVTSWPIEVHLTDASGHVTMGRVLATVRH